MARLAGLQASAGSLGINSFNAALHGEWDLD
jgi:hypothetical protein